MRIRINGVEQEAPEGATLLGLLQMAQLPPGRVAIEVNGHVIARSRFERLQVRDGDVLEIVQFVGGG